VLLKQKRLTEAEDCLRTTLACRRKIHSVLDQSVIHSLLNLGECTRLMGKLDESIELYGEAVASLGTVKGADHPGTSLYLSIPCSRS
jgi:tetratricopeptide (TPR) repeat protein